MAVIKRAVNSVVSLAQSAAENSDFVNAFDHVIEAMGLHPDNQGELALIHALLQFGARYSSRRGPHTKAFEEVIAVLEEASINPHALAYLRKYMNAAYDAYVRRN